MIDDPKIVKHPARYRYRQSVRAKEMWAQAEPSEEMVWEVCVYTNGLKPCHHCPRWEDDRHHGRVQRGCYSIAAEACRVVFAMQKREKK